MRLLFDQNISFRVAKKLQNHFPGCMHVSDCKLNDSEDSDIWGYAKNNNLVIVTYDSDFYDISIINGHPPKILWIRAGNLKTNELVQLLTDNQKIISGFIEKDEFKDIACLELER
jgi:predicted nuclease of predicted toxin-antitoxin system